MLICNTEDAVLISQFVIIIIRYKKKTASETVSMRAVLSWRHMPGEPTHRIQKLWNDHHTDLMNATEPHPFGATLPRTFLLFLLSVLTSIFVSSKRHTHGLHIDMARYMLKH